MNSKEITAQLTLEEKASLCSGRDFWTLKSIERLGLQSIMVTDGPHGLRKQAGDSDHLGINNSVPATCFPAACTTSCSFDRELLAEIGAAMGEECLQESVAVILGPGANIKRSPLCGRNFEYVSEDPYLTGELTAALIKGVQSKGVGTSLKHYAANNQEKCRLSSNSVVDERALREIYLAGFERAVKKSQPWTVMCSYNKVNGVYASEHKKLLTDILRDEWGFQGLVMTDWGAADDRVEGVRTGLDLEMPGSGGFNDAKILEAVKNGSLDEAALDKVVIRVVDLILKAQENAKPGYAYNTDAHHATAKKAAAASAVLLKNEGDILPLAKGKTVAVIGAFAKTPRYQGAGSSKINPTRMDTAFDWLVKSGVSAEYAPGYTLTSKGLDETLIQEAVELAKKKDIALVFAGLPDEYESEGFDRTALDMPESHNKLIQAVSQANPNTIVVLQLGAPVLLPWADTVKGILLTYLGGQAGGAATAELLTGLSVPGGKLAETWCLALSDNPSYQYFPGNGKTVEYRESIFVGYRYYDTADKAVAFPFGYGLSYTTFEYSDLKLDKSSFKQGDEVQVRFKVRNTGKRAGSEIAQLYVSLGVSKLYRAKKELKGFEKVWLEPGESKTITLTLDTRSFAYYNVPVADWAIESGTYTILIGSSSRDIRLQESLNVEGDGKETSLSILREKAPEYFRLKQESLTISDASYTAVYGQPLPSQVRPADEPFTINSTLEDIKDTQIGKVLIEKVAQGIKHAFGEGGADDLRVMMERMLLDMPLRSVGMMSGGMLTPLVIEGLVDALNGKPNLIVAELLK